MNRPLLASGIACATVLFPLSIQAASFSSLTVFGDSLSDSGNLYNLTDAFGMGSPPSPPYNQRFSNGLLWIDQLQAELGLSPTLVTELTLPPDPAQTIEGINFAFGGSLSSDVNVGDNQLPPPFSGLLPGLQDQIDAFNFFVNIGLPVDPTGLFVIWAGANDYTEFFADPTVSAGRSPADIPQEATDNIIGSIVNLAQLGAKNILVPNLPPIGLLPFADILDAALPQQDIPTLLSHLSAAHNQLLAAKLDGVEAQFNDVNLIELDIDGLVAEIIANPTAFGFSNVETPCLTILQNGGFCNPDEFLFWDETHPTEATHSYVAELALTALDDRKASEPASTPEPGMAVATLMAFGLTGLWRRQRVSSVDVDKLVA